MKQQATDVRYGIFILLIIISGFIMNAPAYADENIYKLKEGARAQICIECHETIQKTLDKPFVHTPVKIGECSGCHNPHTSNHGKLLDDDINRLCYSCHKSVIPEGAGSVHQVVLEGKCVSCHDPHASDNKFILVKKGNELCYECHADLGELVKSNEFKHEPMEKDKGCINCHDPHASAGFGYLLRKEATALCLDCHKTSEKNFARRHMDYPVEDSRCTSCHNSHGSNKKGIMYNDVHEPVALRKCEKCHEGPDSPTPLKTRQSGVQLCRECHSDMIEGIFRKNRVHWPLLDQTGCLNCHDAHAARGKGLLAGAMVDVCGQCHEDNVRLQKISINNPDNKNICKPVKEGNCIDCHTPHSSDNALLIAEDSISFGTCNKCHEWQTHSSHPIGEKIIDPRNKNLIVDCQSCHRSCGTGNRRAMMHFENTYAMCIQCHEGYKR